MQSSKSQAMKEKSAHAFVPQVGYVKLGALPLPSRPIAEASECEPPVGAANKSWHILQPPKGANERRMGWYSSTKEWMPMILGAGKRLAFESSYLAAHGWTYVRAATSEDVLR